MVKSLNNNSVLFMADIVSGCNNTSPVGTFKAGKWVKDKTNFQYGTIPWSENNWANPYGPYFLKIFTLNGNYTTYGIHGMRGPLFGNFEKPPIPETMLNLFLDKDEAQFLYCSHGCIRISNQNITKLFNLLNQRNYLNAGTTITIEK